MSVKSPGLNSSSSATSLSSLRMVLRTPSGLGLMRTVSSSSFGQGNQLNDGGSNIKDADDLEKLQTWTDVFEKYGPSQARDVSVSLRSEAFSKRQQLRSLVGESYRDLLATADTIIGMNGLVDNMEAHFRELATGCSSGNVRSQEERIRLARQTMDGRNMDAKRTVVMLRTLADILFACERQLITYQEVSSDASGTMGAVMVSKLLLIADFFAKWLSSNQRMSNASYLSTLLKRQKRVEEQFEIQIRNALCSCTTAEAAELLAGFGLARGLSSMEALNLFLNVRGKKLAALFGSKTSSGLVDGIRLLEETTRQAKAVFTGHYARAVGKATSQSILADRNIRSQINVDVDLSIVNSQWVPADILDARLVARDNGSLDANVVEKQANDFLQVQVTILDKGITEASLEVESNYRNSPENILMELVSLRRALFEALLENTTLRQIMDLNSSLAEWYQIVKRQAESHIERMKDIVNILEKGAVDSESSPTLSLWHERWMNIELSDGATEFQQAVAAAVGGREGKVGDVANELEKWLNASRTFKNQLSEMLKIHELAEPEQWVNQQQSVISREYNELVAAMDERIVPTAIVIICDHLKALVLSGRKDISYITYLTRIARQLSRLFSESQLINDVVVKVYEVYAANVLTVSDGIIDDYFKVPAPTIIWHECPTDVSQFIASRLYETYIKPIIGAEDVLFGVPLGVITCRSVVGKRWYSVFELIIKAAVTSTDNGPSTKVVFDNVTKQEETPSVSTDSRPIEAEEDTNAALSLKSDEDVNSKDFAREEENNSTDEKAQENVSEIANSEDRIRNEFTPTPEQWTQLRFDVLYIGHVFHMDVSELVFLLPTPVMLPDSSTESTSSSAAVASGNLYSIDKRIRDNVDACWSRTRLLYSLV
ncbi:hypothetical protein V1511DRAFT_43847 [Dipodascopsis uninucleata]